MRVLFCDEDSLLHVVDTNDAFADEEWHLVLCVIGKEERYKSCRALKKTEIEDVMTALCKNGFVDLREIVFVYGEYGEDPDLPF